MCVRSRPVMRRKGALPSLIFLFTALAFSRGMAAAFVVGPSPLPAPIPFQKPAPPPHVRSHRAMPQTVGAMAGVDDGGLSEEMRLLKEKIRLNKNRAQELERMLGQKTRTSPSPSPSSPQQHNSSCDHTKPIACLQSMAVSSRPRHSHSLPFACFTHLSMRLNLLLSPSLPPSLFSPPHLSLLTLSSASHISLPLE